VGKMVGTVRSSRASRVGRDFGRGCWRRGGNWRMRRAFWGRSGGPALPRTLRGPPPRDVARATSITKPAVLFVDDRRTGRGNPTFFLPVVLLAAGSGQHYLSS